MPASLAAAGNGVCVQALVKSHSGIHSSISRQSLSVFSSPCGTALL